MLKNFINRALDASVLVVDENLVDETAKFLLSTECSAYEEMLFGTPGSGQKDGAVSDIKIYAKALGLYDFLTNMKTANKNSRNVAPKVSGEFDETRKTGFLEFQDFRPKLNGSEFLETGEKLKLTIDCGYPSYFCKTQKKKVTLDYYDLSVGELKLPDFLTSKSISVGDGMALTIKGYETEYVRCPVLEYSSLDVPSAHTYEANFSTSFSADVPIENIALPNGITKKTELFQISMRGLASSFLPKNDGGYSTDYPTFALKPQWIFAREFPEDASKSDYDLQSHAKANLVIYDANGDKLEKELKRNLLHLHGGSISPRRSLYIDEVKNDNLSRVILYDIEFEKGELK